jgi:hypothetical protein
MQEPLGGFKSTFPQRPKRRHWFCGICGTVEAVPFQNEFKNKPLRSATQKNREMRSRTPRLAR